MGDHELDRRYNDQAFKLEITRQITAVQAELHSNSNETKEIKSDVKEFHGEFDKAIYGGLMDKGLIGQAQDNASQIKSLRNHMVRGFPLILLVILFFGEQINPIIKDWLYQKTHLKIFYSAAKNFQETRPRKRITRYTYVIKNVPDTPPPAE